MASRVSNNFRLLLATKVVDFANDTFKIILMQEGFVFNPDTHDLLANVSASEDDRVYVTWSNTSWTAAAGDIGPACGAIIYDDTVVNDPLVGFIDFLGSYTEPDGGIATIANIKVSI